MNSVNLMSVKVMHDCIFLSNFMTKIKSDLQKGRVFLSEVLLGEIQSCMTLTDMRLTEFMGLTEKSATTKLFNQ